MAFTREKSSPSADRLPSTEKPEPAKELLTYSNWKANTTHGGDFQAIYKGQIKQLRSA